MRPIDADELDKVKYHLLPYTHITPSDVNAESYKRGWNDAIDAIMTEAHTITPERKRGRWLEKKVARLTNDRCIPEWQSCKCSECGRYDTRPYMYFFDEPNFCSWCGAEMREDEV